MLSEKIRNILDKWEKSPENAIEILHDLQTECNYLPPEMLKEISKEINVPLNRIYHLATFFEGFSLKERGKYVISVCTGTSCHVKGAPQIVESIERDLAIKDGDTTKDKMFTLKTKACFGACGLAPAVTVNEELYGNVTQAKMKRIIKQYKTKEGKSSNDEKEALNA